MSTLAGAEGASIGGAENREVEAAMNRGRQPFFREALAAALSSEE